MDRLKTAFLQAVVIVLLGFAIAFTHNAFSVNGINPFRKIGEVPVITDQGIQQEEGIFYIGIEGAQGMVESGAMVIDARTAGEYAAGHIPGAVLLDYYEMGSYLDDVLPLLTPEKEIMVYCSGATCEDSEFLAKELYMLGYKRLFVFKGGYEEWEGAGLPVEM